MSTTSVSHDTIREFIASTKTAQSNARAHARTLGELLVGNLEGCDHTTLVAMKRELSRFNIQTGRWSKK